jgi:orotate phosphoribosyltransferase-like protein
LRQSIDEKTIQKIFKLRDKGLTYEQIAAKTGVCIKLVYQKLNQQTKQERQDRNDRIIALRKEGLTHQQIADEVGCHRQTVGSVLQKQDDYVRGNKVTKTGARFRKREQ